MNSNGWTLRLTVVAILLASASRGNAQLTKDQYISVLNSGLDAIIARTNVQRQAPLQFSANLFYAHELVIASVDVNTLMLEVDAFRQAGVQRVDINPGIWPWRADSSDPAAAAAIAKYDAIVNYIRASGLQVALNFQYSTVYYQFQTFQDWAAAAAPIYVQVAQRYQPDVFVVAHEPTTMAARLGVSVSTSQWQSFVQSTAQQIKAIAPRTRLGAGGLSSELTYYRAFIAIPEIDVMTIDIYAIDNLTAYTDMIAEAQAAGKGVYIEETWRSTYVPPGSATSLEQASAVGIGDPAFQPTDAKWLQAISQYAAALGVESVTPFWTQAFFFYTSQDANSALDPGYNAQVIAAIQSGARTPTFQAYQSLIKQLLTKQISLNSASFLPGPTAPDSLVSMFAEPGTTFASATASASSLPLPTSLAGTSVRITDKNGTNLAAPLIYVSATQINFAVPSAAAGGPAIVSVTPSSGATFTGYMQIAPLAPGLYSANASGQGVAAGYVVTTSAAGAQTSQLTFQNDPNNAGQRTTAPIDLGSNSDSVELVLFGTGIRKNSGNLQAIIGGVGTVVDYAGDQRQFVGLDQVNIRIPKSLAGRGDVDVRLLIDSKYTNVVTINIK
jgi:uncharacterized protein (TIGR03437 family)